MRPTGFSLGRWGIPINALAVVYGAAMIINMAWPRAEVYDPTGGHWYLQYFAPVCVGGILVLGDRSRTRSGNRQLAPLPDARSSSTPSADGIGDDAAQRSHLGVERVPREAGRWRD